jgi:hypothetical protein
MVPFHLDIELKDQAVGLDVEQLDYLADSEGIIRYDVRGDLRHAVISVNIENDPQSPDFTFEAMQSTDEAFSGDELLLIIKAIREHNDQAGYPFERLPFVN